MTSPRSQTRAYDAEGSALKYWMNRLQRLCTGRTDLEAIREATKTLGRATQLFFESRQRYLDSLPEEERNPAIMEFDELIDKLNTTQSQADELLTTAETPSSAEITQPPATKNNDPKTNSTRPIPKLPTYARNQAFFKQIIQYSDITPGNLDKSNLDKFQQAANLFTNSGADLYISWKISNRPLRVRMVHSRLYLNDMNSILPSMPLWR
ncbi:aspartyl/glutamyl-tRNA(Asn/Gln) amidotransferase subunit C, partial [Trichinella spiralis]|uniref:aspartyl/glutamyl-tRNA(Asn/Gln) amidotransferase subunit C n=1 Tax=Trichinella spiralis TaxID=6334 RepID=UPI0001EFDBF2